MAAATTWVAFSSILVGTAASTSRSGTKDSTVSATVVRSHAARGRRAKRRMPVAMTSPTTPKIAVRTANPEVGMGAPPTSVVIPIAWPAAATA